MRDRVDAGSQQLTSMKQTHRAELVGDMAHGPHTRHTHSVLGTPAGEVQAFDGGPDVLRARDPLRHKDKLGVG